MLKLNLPTPRWCSECPVRHQCKPYKLHDTSPLTEKDCLIVPRNSNTSILEQIKNEIKLINKDTELYSSVLVKKSDIIDIIDKYAMQEQFNNTDVRNDGYAFSKDFLNQLANLAVNYNRLLELGQLHKSSKDIKEKTDGH